MQKSAGPPIPLVARGLIEGEARAWLNADRVSAGISLGPCGRPEVGNPFLLFLYILSTFSLVDS